MAIPFLPSNQIQPTYNILHPPITFPEIEKHKLRKFVNYFSKRWLNQVNLEELSIFDTISNTNNGAESYHAKLKAKFHTSHPRI